ncbi:MAG: DNA methylase, partial [Bacteroidota bacterium]
WRADAYLYCVEAKSPATGYWVPLAHSWVISEKYRVCAKLEPDHKNKRYHIRIIEGVDDKTYKAAQNGTVQGSEMVCPETGERFPISTIRGDRRVNGEIVYGLRQWRNEDVVPRPDDVFQERLYCIRYVETTMNDKGREITIRHFFEPNANDLAREQKVLDLLKERFSNWQKMGYIPSMIIPDGEKTEEPKRTRGWTHWHHLFNPRQLLYNGLLISNSNSDNILFKTAYLLGLGKLANWNSRLCRWLSDKANEKGADVFSNQALNTLANFSIRSFSKLHTVWNYNIASLISEIENSNSKIIAEDARVINFISDFWITDPPYADAVNYHELGDFFLAWYEKHLPKLFPTWYAESKAALAVKGNDQSFRESMVDCYSNFTRNMPDNGAQVVMFTHQDSAVWADLALILWASGLQVTAAWTIQTETDAVGIKKGNYVQGTVIMVLRKQMSEETAFLSDIQADVEYEVKEQLQKMLDLDDKEDPNFSDTDYQLAAYAAALRVLTSYKKIQDIDVQYELMKERTPGEKNEIQKIIDSAVAVACDYLVPSGFDSNIWRVLTPEERFFVKGLEIQSHGEYRNGVFQELARGFGIRQYGHMLKSGKANETRLMTATEFATKNLHDEGFGRTMLRNILFAIRETVKDESPQTGRNWLHTELTEYWAVKQRIIHILKYIERTAKHIDHWADDVSGTKLLAGYIENDHV